MYGRMEVKYASTQQFGSRDDASDIFAMLPGWNLGQDTDSPVKFCQEYARIVPLLRHDPFLPHPCQFIIHSTIRRYIFQAINSEVK
jgi:hypothetical protein